MGKIKHIMGKLLLISLEVAMVLIILFMIFAWIAIANVDCPA